MIRIIKLGLAAAAVALTMGAVALPAMAADNVPPSDPNGCTGYYTHQYKQGASDAGATGSAIGGSGSAIGEPGVNNKDGNKGGQAHSDAGRGQMVQDFHDQYCADWVPQP